MYRHSSYEFKVERVIGAGAFGKVYEVSLPTCNFRYALKKFAPRPHIRDSSAFVDGELLQRFSQEIKYQTECNHKNIVSSR